MAFALETRAAACLELSPAYVRWWTVDSGLSTVAVVVVVV